MWHELTAYVSLLYDSDHDHEHACDGDTNKNSLFTALIGIHIFTDELSPAPMLGLCLGTFYIFSLLSLLYIYVNQQTLALGLNMDLE